MVTFYKKTALACAVAAATIADIGRTFADIGRRAVC